MIIWKNLKLNISCLIFDIIIFVIFIIDHYKNNKEYKKDKELRLLIILLSSTIIIFFTLITILVALYFPCRIPSVPMMHECVACLDDSKVSGIYCNKCGNTPLCEECYILWKDKGGTCPLCRNYYIP